MIKQSRTWMSRLDLWRKGSVNRSIFAAMLTVGGFALVSAMAVAAKDVAVAHQFGTSDMLDAFLIAFAVPSFLIIVIAGSFHVALLPIYIEVQENEGRDAAQRVFSNVMIWSTISLIVTSVLLALTAPYVLPVLASGFEPEKLALTHSLFYLLLPILVINGLAMIWRAVLNAGERFALAAATPSMPAIVTVAVLLVMGGVWGIYALVVGTVAGFVLEAGLLAWGLKRQQISLVPRLHVRNPATRRVMVQCVALIAGAFLTSSAVLVDMSMAAMLESGSVSAFSYGTKLTNAVIGVGALAIGTAVLPYFSRMVAINDWSGVRYTLKSYYRLILLLTVPLALALAYFSEPLIGLLFQRGSFTAADTRLSGQIQALYILQLPAYMLNMLVVRLISSLKANHLLAWGAAISFPSNIALNYVLMQWLGVAGIALSTTLVVYMSLGYLTVALLIAMKKERT
jgi:putative peptidoglycan lipid II flippase